MDKIEVKTSECVFSSEEADFFKALSWARSMADCKDNGEVKSAEVFDDKRIVASLKVLK